jgi:hypothetical protein
VTSAQLILIICRTLTGYLGFAKNERDNIGADDLRELADYGGMLLGLSEPDAGAMVTQERLWEVKDDDEEI